LVTQSTRFPVIVRATSTSGTDRAASTIRAASSRGPARAATLLVYWFVPVLTHRMRRVKS
jgi:hypothetical protein